IDDYLSDEAQDFFGAVTAGLDAAGVAWTREPSRVRGLDYYRHTAFEFVTDRLGAQGTVIGGGRYDGMKECLCGPATQAMGWAGGIERLAMLVGERGDSVADVVVVVEDDAQIARGVEAVTALRREGFSAELVASGSPRKRFDKTVKMGAGAIASISTVEGAAK